MRPGRLLESVTKEQVQPARLSRTPSSYILPLQLRGKVPECAQQCLLTFIQQEYNCPCNGLAALCRTYSSRGFTLGELAYICLHQDCGRATTKESLDQYDICDSIQAAVPATYSVLTIPATRLSKPHSSTVATTKSNFHTNTLHPTSESSGVKSRPRGQPTTVSAAAKGTNNPTTMSPSRRPSSSVTSAAASTSPSVHSSKLTATAAIGISVGVLAVTILIIAAMYFFFCVRRRNPKQYEGGKPSDFANKIPTQPSSRLTIRPADSERRIIDRDTIQCWQQLANPSAQRFSNNVNALPEVARSYGNTRTSSRALPSPRLPIKARALSTATAMTIFEEEGEDEDIPPVPTWKNLGLPPNPRAKHHSPPVPTPSPDEPSESASRPFLSLDIPRSPLPLEIPKSATRTPTTQVPSPGVYPSFADSNESFTHIERRGSTGSRSRSRDSSGSLLNYYASSEAGVVTPSVVVDSPVAMELEIPKRHARPPQIEITKPTYPKSAMRRNSAGSDTSFESMDLDEHTPPLEEDKQLTPVQESPASTPMLRTPPISAIRYPCIPRSANDRSPTYATSLASFSFSPKTPKPWNNTRGNGRAYSPSHHYPQDWPLQSTHTPDRQTNHTSKLSGSTLAAKRRGDNAAHDLELNLDKFGTTYTGAYVPHHSLRNYRQESPLKGYERSSARKASRDLHRHERSSPGQYETQEPPLKSPVWEPKLTPQRRGDDLYLQVGVATPMSATFLGRQSIY